jgi:hypothetical protein
MTGGVYDNSPDNLTGKISVELHAALHKDLWEHFGKIQDFMAYKMLLGESKSKVMDSPEVRKKRSDSQKISMLGNTNGSGNKGRHNTKEQNANIAKKTKKAMADPLIREKYLKAKNTPEALQKQIEGVRKTRNTEKFILATHTDEFKEKSRQSVAKNFHTKETIEKKNKTLKSPEFRKKQSELLTAIWAKKKELKNASA